MYIQNIRDAIFNLSDEEEKIFLKKLRNILKFQYGKDVRPKTLKGRVLKFVHGTKPNSDYLEAYLLTFDEIKQNGAVNALQGEKIDFPQTWRDLLFLSSNAQPLPPNIIKHLDEETVQKELRDMFHNSVMHCESNNTEQFFKISMPLTFS